MYNLPVISKIYYLRIISRIESLQRNFRMMTIIKIINLPTRLQPMIESGGGEALLLEIN